MKKILLIITLLSVLGVSGCGTDKMDLSVQACTYETDKDEYITKNSTGANVAEISFELPVFTSEKYETITDAMKQEKDLFFEEYKDTFDEYISYGEESDYREGYFPYYCTSKIQSINTIQDHYCSVITEFEWYAGGTHTFDTVSYNYSIEDGEKIALSTICDLSEKEIKKKIKKGLDRQKIEYDEFAQETINAYGIDDFSFYFDHDGIYIIFPTGEISSNADGCITIPIVNF